MAKGLGITETWLLGLQWRNGGELKRRRMIYIKDEVGDLGLGDKEAVDVDGA